MAPKQTNHVLHVVARPSPIGKPRERLIFFRFIISAGCGRLLLLFVTLSLLSLKGLSGESTLQSNWRREWLLFLTLTRVRYKHPAVAYFDLEYETMGKKNRC